jgi:hypothetical protein
MFFDKGFRRFGVNVPRVASLLDNRTERELLNFLNTAHSAGYSALFLEAMKEYEACHGKIPESDRVRTLVMGKWSLPASALATQDAGKSK